MRSIITLGFSIVPARAQADVETGCADLARWMHDLAIPICAVLCPSNSGPRTANGCLLPTLSGQS